jgi:hypothetical protein
MKAWEIIREAQENGAKIRKKCWSDKYFFVTWNGKKWLDGSGVQFNIVLDEYEWEIYEEPRKYFSTSRAFYWLEKCKKVKRKDWPAVEFIWVSFSRVRDWNGDVIDGRCVTFLSEDWHLCDENGNYLPEPTEEVKQ